MQFFHLIFTQPGAHLLEHSCMSVKMSVHPSYPNSVTPTSQAIRGENMSAREDVVQVEMGAPKGFKFLARAAASLKEA